ncbi:hypothetical protein FQN60_003234 [Etheostoma spectabile]|uniref:Uncharacterized protein n=1 Tax=Etheostoma spectabile TaxID=54343 RepID=A0A5J5CLM8_9PERO|nr:hypothetical protein FQN60_003234 [Etheostoma spectabile]
MHLTLDDKTGHRCCVISDSGFRLRKTEEVCPVRRPQIVLRSTGGCKEGMVT